MFYSFANIQCYEICRTPLLKMILALMMALLTPPALATEGYFFGVGKGMSDALIQSQNISNVNVVQGGFRFDTDYQIDNGLLKGGTLEVETYLTLLDGEQNIAVLALRPVLSFTADAPSRDSLPLIWQLGLGVSLFSNRHLEAIELSTDAQFALMAGVGTYLDKARSQRLLLRYNHYSNGYIKAPNQGLDYMSIDWQLDW